MKIHIEIESFADLKELFALIEGQTLAETHRVGELSRTVVGLNVKNPNAAVPPPAEFLDESEEAPSKEVREQASPFATGTTGGEPTDATRAEGRRKRRTKAEIAADEAAKLAPPVTFDKPAEPLDNLKSETTTTTLAEGTAPPSDIDHLRRCREFISEHSMATYEKSFALADLAGKNIMAFTDADRAKHGAALDLLAANPGA